MPQVLPFVQITYALKCSAEMEIKMLIIDHNSVYEIDEECVKTRKIPKECGIYEKIQQKMEDKNLKKSKGEKAESES